MSRGRPESVCVVEFLRRLGPALKLSKTLEHVYDERRGTPLARSRSSGTSSLCFLSILLSIRVPLTRQTSSPVQPLRIPRARLRLLHGCRGTRRTAATNNRSTAATVINETNLSNLETLTSAKRPECVALQCSTADTINSRKRSLYNRLEHSCRALRKFPEILMAIGVGNVQPTKLLTAVTFPKKLLP